jgi:hypothetical protein
MNQTISLIILLLSVFQISALTTGRFVNTKKAIQTCESFIKERDVTRLFQTKLDTSIDSTLAFLTNVAEKKSQDSNTVVEALLKLEKEMREKNLGNAKTPCKTLRSLDGSWRLVFTTGTIDTQKKTGRINYFPVKAIQRFDTSTTPYSIENGIYLGNFSLLRFKGDFDWNVLGGRVTKLTFDFNQINLLGGIGGGINIQLKKGQAAEFGSKTGLGSEGNVDMVKNKGKRPFFNWISANRDIATARGGGGGLALWKRYED